MSVTITIPDEIADVLSTSAEEREQRAREALALELYREGKISLRRMGELAGVGGDYWAAENFRVLQRGGDRQEIARGGRAIHGAGIPMTTTPLPNDDAGTHVVEADLALPEHASAVLAMLEAYSADAMGDGHPLSAEARANVIAGLRAHPTTLVFLAFHAGAAVGVATCFRGFSTFAAKPLINVHDFYVVPSLRGRGVARALMAAVERKARETGCCKLTLEVLENNVRARRLYEACGFAQATYAEGAGGALFLWKPLQGI